MPCRQRERLSARASAKRECHGHLHRPRHPTPGGTRNGRECSEGAVSRATTRSAIVNNRRYRVEIEVQEADTPHEIRLRAFLKHALRTWHIRCLRLMEIRSDTTQTPTKPKETDQCLHQ